MGSSMSQTTKELTKPQEYALDIIKKDFPDRWFGALELVASVRHPEAICIKLYEKGYLQRTVSPDRFDWRYKLDQRQERA